MSSKSPPSSATTNTATGSRPPIPLKPCPQPLENSNDRSLCPAHPPTSICSCADSGRASPGRCLAGFRGRLRDALGGTSAVDSRLCARPGGKDHGGDHHHCHRLDPGLRRYQWRFPQADPDRLRPVHCLRRVLILPELLQLCRRGGDRMTIESDFIAGFEVPLHRSLAEPILLGGAPRNVAILNGTLAAVVGLGLQLWIPGLVLWLVGHSLAVWGARLDPQFLQVFARHIKHRPLLDV